MKFIQNVQNIIIIAISSTLDAVFFHCLLCIGYNATSDLSPHESVSTKLLSK